MTTATRGSPATGIEGGMNLVQSQTENCDINPGIGAILGCTRMGSIQDEGAVMLQGGCCLQVFCVEAMVDFRKHELGTGRP